MAGEEPGPRRRRQPAAAAAALGTALLIALAASLPGPASAQLTASKQTPRAGDGRGGFRLKKIGNFDSPVYVNGPKGANGLLFVVEQRGVIRLVKGGHKLGGAFLDIHDKVSSGGERGLLSVAFPRSYTRSHRFYVFFTGRKGDLTVQEYRTSRRNPRKARRGSARTVIRIRHRKNANHNGGQLQFGPDGYLYITTGDGGGGGDPPKRPEQTRCSARSCASTHASRAPARRTRSRPTTRSSAARAPRRICAYGLRNPWRFSFDRRRRAGDRRRRPGRARGDRLRSASGRRTAPTSAGTAARASSPRTRPCGPPQTTRSTPSSTTRTRRAAAARSPAATSCAIPDARATAATCTRLLRRPDPLAGSAHERRSRRPLGQAAEPIRHFELRRRRPPAPLPDEREQRRALRGRPGALIRSAQLTYWPYGQSR